MYQKDRLYQFCLLNLSRVLVSLLLASAPAPIHSPWWPSQHARCSLDSRSSPFSFTPHVIHSTLDTNICSGCNLYQPTTAYRWKLTLTSGPPRVGPSLLLLSHFPNLHPTTLAPPVSLAHCLPLGANTFMLSTCWSSSWEVFPLSSLRLR